jgi:hypothetical protein
LAGADEVEEVLLLSVFGAADLSPALLSAGLPSPSAEAFIEDGLEA